MWRAPARRLIQNIWPLVCRKQTTKIIDLSPMAIDLFGGKERGTPRATSRPIHLISSRKPSTFIGLARHEAGWPWVGSMSRSKVSSPEPRLISVFTIFNAEAQVGSKTLQHRVSISVGLRNNIWIKKIGKIWKNIK